MTTFTLRISNFLGIIDNWTKHVYANLGDGDGYT
jgi:hypothetical protein